MPVSQFRFKSHPSPCPHHHRQQLQKTHIFQCNNNNNNVLQLSEGNFQTIPKKNRGRLETAQILPNSTGNQTMRKAPKSNNNNNKRALRSVRVYLSIVAMVNGSCRRQLRALYSFAVTHTRVFLSFSLTALSRDANRW